MSIEADSDVERATVDVFSYDHSRVFDGTYHAMERPAVVMPKMVAVGGAYPRRKKRLNESRHGC